MHHSAPPRYYRSPTKVAHSRLHSSVHRSTLNCIHHLPSLSITTTQWTITNCTSVCSTPIVPDPTIVTTFAEIYLPSNTLPYGIYQLKLTVTMTSATQFTASAYVKIVPSGVAVNIAAYGTSMIARGREQNLTLDPGQYSLDLDGNAFNASVRIELL